MHPHLITESKQAQKEKRLLEKAIAREKERKLVELEERKRIQRKKVERDINYTQLGYYKFELPIKHSIKHYILLKAI